MPSLLHNRALIGLALFGSAWTFPLFGLCWNGSLDLTTGYRQDRVNTAIETFSASGQQIESNDLSITNLSLWEVGLRAAAIAEHRWVLRGQASVGLIADGNLKEKASTPVTSSVVRAKARRYISQDYSVSIGYRFPFNPCLDITALGGWSLDSLKVRFRNAKLDGVADPVTEGAHYAMQWQGPWLGFETYSRIDCYDLNAGYELHLPHWRAKYQLKRRSIAPSSTDTRKAKDAFGNVFYLELGYLAFCHLEVRLRTQYQYWIAKHGHVEATTGNVELLGFAPGQEDQMRKATWQSIGIQLQLGYAF